LTTTHPVDCVLVSRAARDTAPGSRVVNFTRTGEKRFAALFSHDEE
jgi:hypothetical protein